MAAAAQYIHDPLDPNAKEIRLLTIYPAVHQDDPVRCALKHTALSSAGVYKALSYVWGDPTSTTRVTINGTELQITTNLDTALRYIRGSTEEQTFWVDGICINQTDMSERSEQVLLIAEIFQKADRVVAWLGEEREDSTVAMNMIPRFSGVWTAYTNQGVNPGKGLLGIPTSFESRVWDSMHQLFSRIWWRRMWIYQEVILATNITLLCGQASIDWEELSNTYLLMAALLMPKNAQNLDVRLADGAVVVMEMSNWVSLVVDRANRNTQPRPRMMDLLRSCLSRRSTDPRDRFYALMGLAEDANYYGKPAYDKSIESVYENFARRIINREQSLALLPYARGGSNTPEEGAFCHLAFYALPSWTPHWQWGPSTSIIDPRGYNAGGSTRPDFYFEPGILYAKAVMADLVAQVVTKPFLGDDKRHWVNAAMEAGVSVPYPTGVPRLQAFFRTLLADCAGPGTPRLDTTSEEFANLAAAFLLFLPFNGYDDGEIFDETVEAEGKPDYVLGLLEFVRKPTKPMPTKELLDLYFGSFFPEPEPDLCRGRHNTKPYAVAESWTTRGRFFFMTDHGFMGLTSSEIQAGDGIYILPSCPLPMILRADGDSCQVVGECFVLGLMDGEGLGLIGEEKPLQELKLR